jgi:hypothetical protein
LPADVLSDFDETSSKLTVVRRRARVGD